MSTALYYYTLIIMLISVIASSTGWCIYLVTRRRHGLMSMAGFGIYFLDVALTFRTDVMRAYQPRDMSVYTINGPVESIVLGAGLIAAFWAIVLEYLSRPLKVVALPVLLFVVGSITVLLTVPPGRIHEFAFFLVRDVMIVSLPVVLVLHYLLTRDEVERQRLRAHRLFFGIASFFACATIVWNIYFQLIVDYSHSTVRSLPFLPERNFMENALVVTCAVFCWSRAWRSLQLRYVKTPQYSQEDRRREYVQVKVGDYARKYALSAREAEILALIVEGHSTKELASTLFVAESTVKVHVHNVLTKTAQANRIELVKHFWGSL